ncbi:hypothetical protein AB0F15_36610 [Amycolatopsis sp. NPDC026612]|uniref:hypothetical protein n=1 Tax=Amycolatopsis sp. NPDC026612 TaxID=3155466 RepID=UPI0033DCADB2
MTDDPDAGDDDWHYAPAKSLRGALQRGHGAAGAWAATHPVAPDLVLECLHRDYRWDRQVDERTVFLARLVLDLGLSVDPVVDQVRAGRKTGYDGNRFGQAVDVLATVALAHVPAAADALRQYVGEGERWLDVLHTVVGTWPRAWWDDLAPIVAGRAADAAREDVAALEEPWLSWAGRDRRIDVLLERAQPSFDWQCPSRLHHDTPVTALLGLLADPDAAPGTLSAVLHEFARHRDPEPRLLDVTDPLAARPDVQRIGLFPVLQKLGPRTTRHARQWARDPAHPLWWRAVVTLAEHGEAVDVPALLAALDHLDSDTDDWCGYDALARGFARLGVAEVAPRFRSLWRHSPHSYERTSYLEVLLALDPDATRQELPEALSDCESDVRLLAAQHAPLTGEVRRQLVRLRDSAIEHTAVRAAAALRLASE